MPGSAPRCELAPTSTLDVNDNIHKLLFGSNTSIVVGLTETMFASTDGYSVLYYSTAKQVVSSQVAQAVWPIPVDVRMGIAAVSYGNSGEEGDDGAHGKSTSMMGCRSQPVNNLLNNLLPPNQSHFCPASTHTHTCSV